MTASSCWAVVGEQSTERSYVTNCGSLKSRRAELFATITEFNKDTYRQIMELIAES